VPLRWVYIKKEKKYKCISLNKYGDPCNRYVSTENTKCCYHIDSNIKQNTEVNLLLKEKKKKKIVFEKYRNMNCIQYLERFPFNIKQLSNKYTTFKDGRYNFTIKSGYYFYDNNTRKEGNGLLNLIMYMYNYNLYEAVKYIENYMKENNILSFFSLSNNIESSEFEKNKKLNLNSLGREKMYKKIPVRKDSNLKNIKKYLISKRKLDKRIINKLINDNRIYADNNNNCIFKNF